MREPKEMRDAEEVAREALGIIAGPLRQIFRDGEWLDVLDVLIEQEAEHLADLIRARDAEVRAATLAEFTEWYAPAYTAPNGNTCPIGQETVAREFAASDARDMASPEDETPVYVARRLVGPWEPDERTPEQRSDDAIDALRASLTGPEAFAHSRARCARCDHRRKDHDGAFGVCARYDDPGCSCTGFEDPEP